MSDKINFLTELKEVFDKYEAALEVRCESANWPEMISADFEIKSAGKTRKDCFTATSNGNPIFHHDYCVDSDYLGVLIDQAKLENVD